MFIFWLGLVAGLCSTVASLPQLWAAYHYRATQDLHAYTLCLRMVGCLSWCYYGLLLEEYTLAVSSALAFLIECLLIIAKCNYHPATVPT